VTAEPLHASVRSDRPSGGHRVAEIAEALGTPLMVWQRLVVDGALELDGAAYRHRNVTITTPRQVGKSTLVGAVMVERLRSTPGAVVLFGAQNRMASRAKLLDGWWPMIQRSPFASEFKLSRGSGFEALRHENGSILRLLSAEESSGHGESVDLVVLDEGWSLEAHVEQAVRPATIRRPGAQIWCCSTAGTDRSVWWRSKVDAGRQAVADGTDAVCFFEWSAPIGADPADPATWRACHPALAEGVVEQSVIEADFAAMPEAEFVRAYLNWWSSDLVDTGWTTFDQSVWLAAKR
jgi:phage terminase large subunit-like protein